jgi:2-polyprenyl-3-methyl-5-hydroxy-6-metoxy-1,4-benzoquinol methylase
MSLTIKCPLGHDPVSLVERVSIKQLAVAYRSQYNIKIEGMLGTTDEISFCRCEVCGLRFFDPATPGPPEFYAELSRIPWYYAEEKEEYRLAARRVGERQKVLEVGCGTGNFAKYLKKPNYVGLEYNGDAVRTARGTGLDVRADSVENFATSHKDEFDVVCSFQVLEHVPHPSSFIEACVACARPGGLVIFGVPNSDGYLAVQPDELLNMPPHHLTWWDASVFWNVAAEYGFEVVATETDKLSNLEAYADTKAMRILMGKLKDKRLFLFGGTRYALLKRAAKMARTLLLAGMYDAHLAPSGHSLLAILRKLPDAGALSQ